MQVEQPQAQQAWLVAMPSGLRRVVAVVVGLLPLQLQPQAEPEVDLSVAKPLRLVVSLLTLPLLQVAQPRQTSPITSAAAVVVEHPQPSLPSSQVLGALVPKVVVAEEVGQLVPRPVLVLQPQPQAQVAKAAMVSSS